MPRTSRVALSAGELDESSEARFRAAHGPVECGKLLPITRSLVLGDDARLPAWLDRRLLGRYLDGMERDFNAYRVWSLYILENWLRSHPAVPAEASNELSAAVMAKAG